MSTENKENQKPGRTVLTKRDIEILTHVAENRIVTMAELYARFFVGQKIDAAKSTLRRLRGRQGGQRYLRPQQIDQKRVGYVLTRRGCRTLNLPTKRSKSLGPKTTIQQLALAEYLLGNPTREWTRGDDLRTLLKNPAGRLPQQYFVTEEAEDGLRLKLVFIHFGGNPPNSAQRIGDILKRLSDQNWFAAVLADRCLDIVLLTGIKPAVKTLQAALATVLDQALAVAVRKTVGNERPSAVIGVTVEYAASVEALILARDSRPERGRSTR